MRLHPAKLVLTDDIDTVVIRPETVTAGDGIACKEWDLGSPQVREVVTDRAGGDGTIDRTAQIGSRNVTFELAIRGDTVTTAYEYADRLTAMTHPYRRPSLLINRTNNPPDAVAGTWRMRLRGNPFSVTFGRRAAALIEMQLSFVCPDGVIEGETRGVSTSLVTDPSTSNNGLIFPTAFPWTMGGLNGTGEAVTFTVGGALPVNPNLVIYGPSTNPHITTDAGESFKFTNLNLPSGQYVTVNMAAGTATLNGNPDASMFHLIDFTQSTFWRWNPGAHTVRLNNPGQLIVQWRERRLTI